jgi:hypothetical protein
METATSLERGWLLRLEPGLLKADWKRRFCVVDPETTCLRVLKDEDVRLPKISLLQGPVSDLTLFLWNM